MCEQEEGNEEEVWHVVPKEREEVNEQGELMLSVHAIEGSDGVDTIRCWAFITTGK